MTPLALVPYDVVPSPGNLLVLGLALLATGLSGVVSYKAYQGYRRNDSRPMLFLAVGFAFITVVPFFVDVLFYAIVGRMLPARLGGIVLPGTRYAVQIVGLAFVLYSLYGRSSVEGARESPVGEGSDD